MARPPRAFMPCGRKLWCVLRRLVSRRRSMKNGALPTLAPIAKASFQPAFEAGAVGLSREDVVRLSFGTAHQLVFVNGHFVEHLSSVGTLPPGAIVGSLASALKGNDELAYGFIG